MMTRLTVAVALIAGTINAISSPAEKATSPAGSTNAPVAMRSLFVSVSPLFGELKRPPVLFQHDKHTKKLAAEGCEACHPRKNGNLSFSFPINRDERSARTLMDSIHAACIDCHTKRAGERKESGPVTCGECHSEKKAYHDKEYLPALPRDYETLKDPYHTKCFECHQAPNTSKEHAKDLNWKQFHTVAQKQIEIETPKVVYDYYIHDKHAKTLEKRCDLCHYLNPALKVKLAAEGKEPTGPDWLRETEPGKSWDDKDSAHARCINCHLQRKAAKQAAGPLDCGACHTNRLRSTAEMASTPRPDYGDKQRILIGYEKATLPGVPFDHKSHIAASRSCSECHHETLDACIKCHTPTGSKEGGFVTLADAYHDSDSTWSCIGCHTKEKQAPNCAGCHSLRDERFPRNNCAACHTGNLDTLDKPAKLPDPATLFPKDLKDELDISILEKSYEKSKVQHKKIAVKLTEISNQSKLATAFHNDETTICAGCHHVAPVQQGKPVPACATCHTVRAEPTRHVPALLGAYHQACLGCHKAMKYPENEMPQKCTGCHMEKPAK
jgi:hypothetical protein